MSLEDKIDGLTAAINKLADALGETVSVSIPAADFQKAAEAVVAAETPAPRVDKPKKAKAEPKVEYQDQDGNVTTSAEKKAKEEAFREPPADKITSTQVAQALVGLMKDKGRDAGVAVLQQFGASKVPEIKAEDYPKVLAAIKAAS